MNQKNLRNILIVTSMIQTIFMGYRINISKCRISYTSTNPAITILPIVYIHTMKFVKYSKEIAIKL